MLQLNFFQITTENYGNGLLKIILIFGRKFGNFVVLFTQNLLIMLWMQVNQLMKTLNGFLVLL